MTLIVLPNLYCSPNDVADLLSQEGVDLRLDDKNLATGQTITVTATSAQGATSISVSPLTAPLLIGTNVTFSGGGMTAAVTAVLTAVGKVGDVSLTVSALAGPVNVQASAQDSGVNVVQANRLTKACQYGTTEVKLFCTKRYDDSQLAISWSVNRWATALGAKWLCRRRGMKPPGGVAQEAEEAKERLQMVLVGSLNIEDIGTRYSALPFISNQSQMPGYDLVKSRVEPYLSDATPTLYPQWIDWNSVFLLEQF